MLDKTNTPHYDLKQYENTLNPWFISPAMEAVAKMSVETEANNTIDTSDFLGVLAFGPTAEQPNTSGNFIVEGEIAITGSGQTADIDYFNFAPYNLTAIRVNIDASQPLAPSDNELLLLSIIGYEYANSGLSQSIGSVPVVIFLESGNAVPDSQTDALLENYDGFASDIVVNGTTIGSSQSPIFHISNPSATDDRLVLQVSISSYTYTTEIDPISGTTFETLEPTPRSDFGYTLYVNPHSGIAPIIPSSGDDSLVFDAGNNSVYADGGDDSIFGVAGDDTIDGGAGDDVLVGGIGDDWLHGDEGRDTAVFEGNQSNYTLSISSDDISITDRRTDGQGSDELRKIEILDFGTELAIFGDGPMDLDTFDDAASLSASEFASIVELYIAYFNRAPDAIGLNFWASSFARGEVDIGQMAELFFNQAETSAAYTDVLDATGSQITDIPAFVTAVYSNVLGRAFDEEGRDFWVGVLESGGITTGAFIGEIIKGAKADPASDATQDFIDQQLLDQQYLADKTDVGVHFAVINGMSDTANAAATMALFTGAQDSINVAVAQSNQFLVDAESPTGGEFLMPLVGVLDDPFGVA
jgi:Ca2+-binding RTX toxin-like protein